MPPLGSSLTAPADQARASSRWATVSRGLGVFFCDAKRSKMASYCNSHQRPNPPMRNSPPALSPTLVHGPLGPICHEFLHSMPQVTQQLVTQAITLTFFLSALVSPMTHQCPNLPMRGCLFASFPTLGCGARTPRRICGTPLAQLLAKVRNPFTFRLRVLANGLYRWLVPALAAPTKTPPLPIFLLSQSPGVTSSRAVAAGRRTNTNTQHATIKSSAHNWCNHIF